MSKSLSKIEFFNGYFELLETRGIASVILHTYEAYPEHIHSDVDYCVSDDDLPGIVPLVLEYCRASGWRLVQIMQHESKAYFCICVSKQDPSEYIELDVCSDYMREGKILIAAETLLANRRPYGQTSFHIPSLGAEFCYRLWKSVAKRKPLKEMRAQLDGLYELGSEECSHAMIDLNIIDRDSSSTSWEKQSDEIFESLQHRYDQMPVSSRKGQWQKFIRRVIQPSGLLVFLPTGLGGQEKEALAKRCGHAFRKTEISNAPDSFIRTWSRVLRSTLVLCDVGGSKQRLLGIVANGFDAGLKFSEHTSQKEMVSDVFQYLETRLVKRWHLK